MRKKLIAIVVAAIMAFAIIALPGVGSVVAYAEEYSEGVVAVTPFASPPGQDPVFECGGGPGPGDGGGSGPGPGPGPGSGVDEPFPCWP